MDAGRGTWLFIIPIALRLGDDYYQTYKSRLVA
jgi:hypothetical protein